MPYRGDQGASERESVEGERCLLVLIGALALAYPIARLGMEAIGWEKASRSVLRAVEILALALYGAPGMLALALARIAKTKDARLFALVGGLATLVGLGVEALPFSTIASMRIAFTIGGLAVHGGVAATGEAIARTRRTNDSPSITVWPIALFAVSAGGIVQQLWWAFGGAMSRGLRHWYSAPDPKVIAFVDKLSFAAVIVPLLLLAAGAFARSRALLRAPLEPSVARPIEVEESGATNASTRAHAVDVLRLGRLVALTSGLAALFVTLPAPLLLLASIVREKGPFGVELLGRPLMGFQGAHAALAGLAWAATRSVTNDAELVMKRNGALLAFLAQATVVLVACSGHWIGIDLEPETAGALWAAVAAGSLALELALARALLQRAQIALIDHPAPEGITPFLARVRGLPRATMILVAASAGFLFVGQRSHTFASTQTFWVMATLLGACGVATAIVTALRVRRVFERVTLWQLGDRS